MIPSTSTIRLLSDTTTTTTTSDTTAAPVTSITMRNPNAPTSIRTSSSSATAAPNASTLNPFAQLKVWEQAYEYIRACPFASPDHPAISSALGGLQHAQRAHAERLEQQYPTEYAWNQFTGADDTGEPPGRSSSKSTSSSQLNNETLNLKMSELSRESLLYLVEQAQALSSSKKKQHNHIHKKHHSHNQHRSSSSSNHRVFRKLAHGIVLQVETWTQQGSAGHDFANEEELVLFVDFLRYTRAQEFMIEFVEKPGTDYKVLIEDSSALRQIPETVPEFQTWAMGFESALYPQLSRLLAIPTCHVTSVCCNTNECETNACSFIQLEKVLQHVKGPYLLELSTNWLNFTGAEFGILITALQHCVSLETLEIHDTLMDVASRPMDWMQVLLQQHQHSLRTVALSLGRADLELAPTRTPVMTAAVWPAQTADFQQLLISVTTASCPKNGLRNLTLPLYKPDLLYILPLLHHVANGHSTLANLRLGDFVDMTLVCKNTSCAIRMQEKARKHVYLNMHWEAREHWPEMMQLIPKIPNVNSLVLPECCEGALDSFLSPSCVISDLQDLPLDDMALQHWYHCLGNYTRLVKLSLFLDISANKTLKQFCPKSQLQFVDLTIRKDTHPLSVLTTLLHEQKLLKILKVRVTCPTVSEDADHDWDDFSNLGRLLLQQPLLSDLDLTLPNHTSPTFYAAVLGAMAQSTVLQKLRLNARGLNLMGLLAQLIVQSKTLMQLDFRFPCDDEHWGCIVSALQHNTSLCRMNDVQLYVPVRHEKVVQALRRNRLLGYANQAIGKRLSTNLWPRAIAKLGSNGTEASPVFAYLQAKDQVFSAIVSSHQKKRKLARDEYDDEWGCWDILVPYHRSSHVS